MSFLSLLFSLTLLMSPIHGRECEKLEVVEDQLEYFASNLVNMNREKGKITKHAVGEINSFIISQRPKPAHCKNSKTFYRRMADHLFSELNQCRKIFIAIYRVYLGIKEILKAVGFGEKEIICKSKHERIKPKLESLDAMLVDWGLCNANRYNKFRNKLNKNKCDSRKKCKRSNKNHAKRILNKQ